MSMKSKLMISSAIAGLVALSAISGNVMAQDKKTDKEKCYGVAKKALNDCGTAKHSCAGQSTADNQADEWKFVAKGTCEGMKGSLKKPEAKKASAPATK